MAASDFIQLNSGAGGEKLAVDTNATVSHQRVKVQFGDPGLPEDVTSTNPLPVSPASNGTQNTPLIRYLDTVGDGSGTKNASVDGSSTQQVFLITPPAGVIYRISRMMVYIRDGSGVDASKYGNVTGLTNGVGVDIHNGTSQVLDLMDGIPTKSNADWARVCYDADLKTWGTGDEMVAVRWTFTKGGQYLRLDGDATESLRVLIDDNLTALTEHYFKIEGYIESSPS